MALRPEDVERQVFKEGWRGYDQEEVDRFLDRVSGSLADLWRERDELAARLRVAESAAGEASQAEQLLTRTLLAAQRTADETVAEARATAEATVAEAEHRAAELVGAAEAEAAAVRSAARVEAEELSATARYDAAARVAAARAEAERLQRAVGQLDDVRAGYARSVREVISRHLAAIDAAAELPPLPDALLDLSALETTMPQGGPRPAAASDAADGAAAGDGLATGGVRGGNGAHDASGHDFDLTQELPLGASSSGAWRVGDP